MDHIAYLLGEPNRPPRNAVPEIHIRTTEYRSGYIARAYVDNQVFYESRIRLSAREAIREALKALLEARVF